MNKIYLIVLLLGLAPAAGFAQEFDKSLADARKTYTAGDLSNSRFAMENMLRELDVAIGKEILKALPAKMDALAVNAKDDNVTGGGAGAGMGLFVHRSYGTAPKTASLDIINNSPLITSLNTVLALPFIGRASDGTQKVVKIQGYKAILNKIENSESGKVGYELQVPLQNTLFSFRADDTKEADFLKMAETIPLGKIAQMAN
jgi:hypothetical protein